MNLKQWFKTKTALAIALAGFLLAALLPVQNGAEKTAYAAEDIESALYNYEYYVKANDDVAKALNSDPDAMYNHWLNCGMAEGRNASMVFNAKYYLEVNPEVAAMVGNDYVAAYNHFVTTGIYQGLESSPVFDVNYYLENNTDVANAFNNDKVMAAIHFNTSAIAEGRSGSGNFDYTVYSYCNTDVAELYGDDVIGYYIHYINHGRAEGRTGGFSSNGGSGSTGGAGSSIDRSAASYRIFDVAFYLEQYPGLAGSVGTDPDALYKYWLETGISLGQTASPVIIPEEYRLLNADVADAFAGDDAATIRHFLNSGIYEGRTASYEFDYTIYAYCNTDVASEFDEDIVGYYWHYVNHGKVENRTAVAVIHIHEYDEHYVCKTCDYEYYTKGLSYRLNSKGTYYIVSGIGTATGKKLIIPRTYEGLPVREIANYAFKGVTSVKELLIPSTIQVIGEGAFKECSNLEMIRYNAVNCAALGRFGAFTKAGQEGKGITVIIGSEVPKLPENLFYTRSATVDDESISIVKVIFNGSNVTEIGQNAFYNCKKLTELEIPEGVTKIGRFAFMHCGLKSVVIPTTVKNIGIDAFESCSDLETVQYNAKECERVYDNQLAATSAFQYAGNNSGGIKVIIGSEVTNIPDYLFSQDNNVTEIVFEGNNVIEIGYNAFYKAKLTKIDIPAGVVIKSSAFYCCTNLADVNISENVEIGTEVFYGCSKLTNVTISKGVKRIGEKAFANCTSLTSVALAEPTGWKIQFHSTEMTGLDNPATAAEYLRSTHTGTWIRE